MELTHGRLLGGRLRYAQPRHGFRSGIEPVLLAASVRAKPVDRVLEAGTGAGAGLLCLAARIEHFFGIGVERDPALAVLAGHNARANGQADVCFLAGRIEALPIRGPLNHAFANPPYHPDWGTASTLPERNAAKRAPPGLMADWARAMASPLVQQGTLTLIVATASLPACLDAFGTARCGSVSLFPLWPRAGEPAKLTLVRGVKGGRGPCRLLPGLVLHDGDGRFTEDAEAVLRHGAALRF